MGKNVLIIGGINPNLKVYSVEEEANQAANSRWMWNLVDGFEANDFKVSILNVPNIPSFQELRKRFFHKAYSWFHKPDAEDYTIGYLNVLPFSLGSRERAIKKYCKKFLKKHPDSYIVGITPHFPIVNNIAYFTKKGFNTCLILPDLPDFTGKSRMGSRIYRFLKKIDIRRFYKKIKSIDKFVLLTEKMKEKIGENKKTCVIECIANEKMANHNAISPNLFTIAYTGTVHDHYGIYEIAKAIHNSDLKIKFIICGDGTGLEIIKKDFSDDSRIDIRGSTSPDETIYIQQSSSILINPRPNDGGEYLKYSFPSKTVEYLLAAKPVICFKLAGIPDDYDNCLDYLKSLDSEEILLKIKKYINLSTEEIHKIGCKNRDYVCETKNCRYQIKKIIDLLEEN